MPRLNHTDSERQDILRANVQLKRGKAEMDFIKKREARVSAVQMTDQQTIKFNAPRLEIFIVKKTKDAKFC